MTTNMNIGGNKKLNKKQISWSQVDDGRLFLFKRKMLEIIRRVEMINVTIPPASVSSSLSVSSPLSPGIYGSVLAQSGCHDRGH